MKELLPEFEHRAQRVMRRHHFILRLAHSGIVGLVLVAPTLLVGVLGYHVLEVRDQ